MGVQPCAVSTEWQEPQGVLIDASSQEAAQEVCVSVHLGAALMPHLFGRVAGNTGAHLFWLPWALRRWAQA